MVAYWTDLIKLSHPIVHGLANFQHWVPDVFYKLSETEKAPIFANAVPAAANSSLYTICLDPLGLVSQFLSVNSFTYTQAPRETNEWETSWDFPDTLAQKVPIRTRQLASESCSEILNTLVSLRISLTSHLDDITRLSSPVFVINLSEEWVTFRGVIMDFLINKIRLPFTQSRQDLGERSSCSNN
jgi:hypothetical protein